MKQIRVLQPMKLLGKQRKFNDMVSEKEYYSLPPNIRQALVSNDKIEIFDDNVNFGTAMQQLSARVDLLSDVVQDNLGIKLGDYFKKGKDPKKEATTKGKKKESVSKLKEYKKGDAVFFMDENDKKAKGTIAKVYKRKKIADIDDANGETWEVAFDDILTED